MNGLTFPDRSPHPALWEAKFLAQPVGIELLQPRPSPSITALNVGTTASSTGLSGTGCTLSPVRHPGGASTFSHERPGREAGDGSGGAGGSGSRLDYAVAGSDDEHVASRKERPSESEALLSSCLLIFSLTNRYDFSSLDHLTAEWMLKSAAASSSQRDRSRSVHVRGSIPLEDIAAGDAGEVKVDIDLGQFVDNMNAAEKRAALGEVFVHIEVKLKADTCWARGGHVVAWGCFPIDVQALAGRIRERPECEGGAMRTGLSVGQGDGHEGMAMSTKSTSQTRPRWHLAMYEGGDGEDNESSRAEVPTEQL